MTIKMLGQGPLHESRRFKQHWLTQAERRRAFRYCVAAFTFIAVIVLAWILRP